LLVVFLLARSPLNDLCSNVIDLKNNKKPAGGWAD